MNVRYFLVLFFLFPFLLQPAQADELIEGYTHEEVLRLGEQMYREGILPSGEPMEALVMGDIPFDGRMFTCDDCHQRSGLGSEEGTVITWPTNGKELFAPRRRTGAYRPPAAEEGEQGGRRELPEYYQVADVRPAYTDKSLARLLRVGIDPTGRRLDPIMPKYRLSSKNLAILTYYLKHLSSEMSPGVDDTTIHFATVIDTSVSDVRRSAMLSVLQAHIDAHNSLSRHEDKRAASGPFYKSEKHKAYRKLNLHIWELTGPSETWREQLEHYYDEQPVFALLGGIAEGSWKTIHSFSEDLKIPTIFPITDRPEISNSDWYTLYFSKGYYQEGESVAKYVRSQLGVSGDFRVVQLYSKNNPKAVEMSAGFDSTWQQMGGLTGQKLLFMQGDVVRENVWKEVFKDDTPVVLLFWVDDSDKDLYLRLEEYRNKVAMVFTSASILNNDFSSISDTLRTKILVTYPYSMPESETRSRFSVERWLKARKIPLTDFDIQAKMYFLGWMLPGAIKNMRSEFFRDYFLEGFDMMIDQDYSIAVYPRLTFGPGQRYASKGCYIVKLSSGTSPEMTPVNDWVTY
ncbi:amino acid ABC transporter substrate-binding protein [Desulforhopalus sp. IMCC35007]|uniref:amino acid ABC transporter substrate-binding protein n=1 Tax=Desulforhopalus sp. IMCC35007 TaxID=2569543 RepID=UPI0010ADCB6C|nr:amino acid ABC transporter substrate-binding protein [Desulforhopalus sp. IMCC35007]TKB07280.1 amino acid ABC transporter substrate-binding protein [Desulforhopalus sp. IMCC35007]